MEDGDGEGGGALPQEGGSRQVPDEPEDRQAHHGADEVKVEVDEGGPSRGTVGAHGGEEGRDGGADVLAHDDGDGHGVGDGSRGAEGLEDTDRGGGGLDDGRQRRAGQDAQDGVGKDQEEAREGLAVGEGGHGAAHGLHARHQDGEAQKGRAGVPADAALGPQHQQDADEGQDGGEGGGLQELQHQAVPLDAAEAQEPGGDGGADVGAHDDADGLAELHEAGVHEAHHHDGGGGGGLDHRRDAETQQQRPEGAAGHAGEDVFQPGARGLLQGVPHDVHAEEEEGQAPDEIQHVKNAHARSFPAVRRYLSRKCLSYFPFIPPS